MARKKKPQEVSIIPTKRDSDVVTDLQVIIKDQVIGEIYQGEDERHYQVTNLKDQKGTALTVEDAVQSILADYNLHK
jgi:hypothetical protein